MTGQVRPAKAAEDVLDVSVRWSRIAAVAMVLTGGVLAVVPDAVAVPLALALVVAGLLAGLPHGAVDHLLTGRLTGHRPVVATGLYALVAVVAWVLLYAAGPVALIAVVVLSILHFGLGELEVYRLTTGWVPGRVVAAALVVAGTGALLLPLARSGDQLQRVAAGVSPGLAALLAGAPLRFALAALWIAAACVAGIAAHRAGRPMIVLDIALVGLLGALAPPLVAFAAWFGGWHALRHSGRLLTLEPRCAALVAAGRTREAVRTLARLSAWPTAAAVAVVLALIIVTAAAPDVESAIAEILRVLLALTVPHMLIVGWLDRRAALGAVRPLGS